jgi:predicted nucleotidyltransferase
MAQLSAKVKNTVDRYLQALSQNNVPIKEAILFGSYAVGKGQEWSDIDIALVSDIFQGDRIKDKDRLPPRLNAVRHLRQDRRSQTSEQRVNKGTPLTY